MASPAVAAHTGSGSAKGTLLANLRSYVSERHGLAAWHQLVATLPPRDRDSLDRDLLVSVWYPVGTWNRVIEAYLDTHAPAPAEAIRQIAFYVADRDLSTVLKVVLAVGTPGFILRRAGFLWSRYFDSGVLTALEEEPRRWVLSLDAPTGEDAGAGRPTCAEGVCAWLTRALDRSGAKAVVVHSRCRFSGAEQCRYEVSW